MSWARSIVEAALSLMLPVLMVAIVCYTSIGKKDKLPGKIQEDIGMAHTSLSAPWW